MKTLRNIALTLGFALVLTSAAQAVTLSMQPSPQSVPLGTPVSMDLVISGLGDFAAPSLGAYDVDLSFDAGILALTDVTLGDPGLGNLLDVFSLGNFFGITPGAGTVNIFEVSLDLPGDLEAAQPDSFTLAQLTFDTIDFGMSAVNIGVNSLLGDDLGSQLDITALNDGKVTVTPEPGTWLLMVSGLAGMLGLARKRMRAQV